MLEIYFEFDDMEFGSLWNKTMSLIADIIKVLGDIMTHLMLFLSLTMPGGTIIPGRGIKGGIPGRRIPETEKN